MYGLQSLGLAQINNRDRAIALIGNKNSIAVGMKRHVHRPLAELNALLVAEVCVQDRPKRLFVACDYDDFPVGTVPYDLSCLLMMLKRDSGFECVRFGVDDKQDRFLPVYC